MRVKLLNNDKWDLVPIIFSLLLFSTPLSHTVKSIFLVLSILVVLATPYYNQYLADAYTSLWSKAALIFFLMVFLAIFWSPAPWGEAIDVVGKYTKLVYLPILAVGFIKKETRVWAINSYLLAMCITVIASLLKWKGWLHVGHVSTDFGDLFYNHIVTGYMMALAAYLAALMACQLKGVLRISYSIIVLLTSYHVLFFNAGRTGYFVYFILAFLLFIQQLRLKKALLAVLALMIVMGLIYNSSTVMHDGLLTLIKDARVSQSMPKTTNTSVGFRIQFHDYAHSLFSKHRWLGIGTGGFKYSFSQEQPIPAWGNQLNEPHSQYWFILAEQGLLGLLSFGVFLGCLLFTALTLVEERSIFFGVLITFCCCCFSDTLFCYSAVGYLFIIFSALCLGESISKSVRIKFP